MNSLLVIKMRALPPRMMVPCMMVLCLMVLCLPTSAQTDIANFDNPEQHALYQKVINELRCLVCQNQSLADSNADLAKDLRRKSYEMIRQDKNYDEIIQYMVERYGEFVLYRPRVTPATLLLWFAPFVVLIAVAGFALVKIRKPRKPTQAKFSKQQLDNAKSLIDDKPAL